MVHLEMPARSAQPCALQLHPLLQQHGVLAALHDIHQLCGTLHRVTLPYHRCKNVSLLLLLRIGRKILDSRRLEVKPFSDYAAAVLTDSGLERGFSPSGSDRNLQSTSLAEAVVVLTSTSNGECWQCLTYDNCGNYVWSRWYWHARLWYD
jgi:hypothetical protein